MLKVVSMYADTHVFYTHLHMHASRLTALGVIKSKGKMHSSVQKQNTFIAILASEAE